MESISRDISDLAANEKAVIETVLGHTLRDNQRVIIQVIDVNLDEDGEATTPPPTVKDFAIFTDLEEPEMSELESEILYRSPSRETNI